MSAKRATNAGSFAPICCFLIGKKKAKQAGSPKPAELLLLLAKVLASLTTFQRPD
jgi:hypothetical protein